MSLTAQSLSILQKAGTAVFDADHELKRATQHYAKLIQEAMSTNAFSAGTDGLFTIWKTLAGLSQALSGVEQEMKKAHTTLAGLMASGKQSAAASAANVAAPKLRKTRVAKTAKVAKLAPAAKPAKPAQPTKAAKAPKLVKASAKVKIKKAVAQKRASAPKTGSTELKGGGASLMAHLKEILSTTEFRSVSQTVSGKASGVPLGSMSYMLRVLTQRGLIVAGEPGQFKLPT